ncbi:MAG: tetratricopeptide repeat protein [Desulfobacteraceae bacterium]|nr:MAG: tetratricopeptide repeat protein [Desulfobacteraceae bacterium]
MIASLHPITAKLNEKRKWTGMISKQIYRGIVLVLVSLTFSCVTPSEHQKKAAEDYKIIGSEYYHQGNFSAALKNFLEAEKAYPADAELHNLLGLTYKAKKRNDLAVRHFQKAIDLAPGYSIAKNNLGTVYLDLGKWDQAIPCFKEAANDLTYETPHLASFNLAGAYYGKGDYGLAEQYYGRALEYRPNFVRAMRGLALAHIAMGRYEEAVGQLEQAIRIAPRMPNLYYDLAEAYSLSGRYGKARRSYGKVIELVPGSPLAAEAEKRMGKNP